MNKRILLYDYCLFILEEISLILVSFIIPDQYQSKIFDYIVIAFLFVCVAVISVCYFKSLKSVKVTINDAVTAFGLVITATIIYFVFYNNSFPLLTSVQGTVFSGITMIIGIHGLTYLHHFFLNKSKEFGHGYQAKEYLFISTLFEKISTITTIATIIVVVAKTISE